MLKKIQIRSAAVNLSHRTSLPLWPWQCSEEQTTSRTSCSVCGPRQSRWMSKRRAAGARKLCQTFLLPRLRCPNYNKALRWADCRAASTQCSCHSCACWLVRFLVERNVTKQGSLGSCAVYSEVGFTADGLAPSRWKLAEHLRASQTCYCLKRPCVTHKLFQRSNQIWIIFGTM